MTRINHQFPCCVQIFSWALRL